jgi:hypothetical protein
VLLELRHHGRHALVEPAEQAFVFGLMQRHGQFLRY